MRKRLMREKEIYRSFIPRSSRFPSSQASSFGQQFFFSVCKRQRNAQRDAARRVALKARRRHDADNLQRSVNAAVSIFEYGRERELSFSSSASSYPRVPFLAPSLSPSTCSCLSTPFAHRRRGRPRGPWIRALGRRADYRGSLVPCPASLLYRQLTFSALLNVNTAYFRSATWSGIGGTVC